MLASRVLPGAALVRASFVRVSAFKSVDLPTFERPANAIWARPSAGISSARTPAAALVTNSVLRIFNAVRYSRFAVRGSYQSGLALRTSERRTANLRDDSM